MASGINIYSELVISRIRIPDLISANEFLISGIGIIEPISIIPIVDIRNTNCCYQECDAIVNVVYVALSGIYLLSAFDISK